MIQVREARIGDVEALQDLYMHHLTQMPPPEAQDTQKWQELLQELIQTPRYYLLVGEVDGRVVSSVTLIIIKNLTHNLRPYALIENVVSHADFRGRGYASAVMQRASEIAQHHDCYKIMLMTGSKKQSTLNFYENCGFDMAEKTAFLKKL